MTASLLPPSSPEWRAALQRASYDIYQLPEYVTADALNGGGDPAAFHWREGDQEMLLPLVVREFLDGKAVDVSSSYGYASPIVSPGLDNAGWNKACAALLETLESLDVVSCFVRLHPLLAADVEAMERIGVIQYHGDTVNIDLCQSEEALWSLMRQNHRRDVTKAAKAGYDVFVDEDWSHMDEFIDMYYQTMRRVNAAAYYFFHPDYFERLRAELGGNVYLMFASKSGQLASGAIFTEAGGIAGYHLGATQDEHLTHAPAKLVMNYARQWAKARGNKCLHLGGGVGGSSEPLLRYKLGFSNDRRPFRTWRVVVDEARYRDLCALTHPEIDPADRSSFFPLYRAPAVEQ
ncbi:MAG: hypothetical protein QOJ19_5000 [Acidimicrobiia bacterium]|jgi:hypothetical protein|nr:hypothetical protein [Acidimicrobiia bacterium]